MRILALVLMASLPFGLMAQKKVELSWPAMKLDASTKLITYSGVPEVGGVSAQDLFDRALKWGGKYHKNFAEKLRKQDREAGEMEIFVRFPIFVYDAKGVKTTSTQGLVQYTLTLRFRDGRYKYTVTDLNLKATSYEPLEKWLDKEDANAKNHAYYLTDVDTEIQNMIEEMTKGIAKAEGAASDEW
ncbi:MAG: DUF4468 domain-containing protein [Flavobacteriales bacterium]|nr:DUF4468 domain-containing protein [Flavobacteriales bacterium]